MVFCVSKLLVSFAVGGIVYGIWSMSSNKLNDILVPVILSMLGTFLVCSILFRVYSVAVDTIFLCFCEYFVFFIILYKYYGLFYNPQTSGRH